MKFIKAFLILAFLLSSSLIYSQEMISPFYKLGEFETSIQDQSAIVKELLTASEFKIIGEYHPEKNDDLFVVAFTSDELIELCRKFSDRGLLAATLKIGFVSKDGKTVLSMLNPEYQFRAYIYEGFDNYSSAFISISNKALQSVESIRTELTPFGGEEKREKLYKYRYKMMMPYFTDPVELNEFSSFSEGLGIILKNLNDNIGNTAKVYEIIDQENEIAVFGVALYDVEKGENDFLPVIGEQHIAAMPYDMILQGNTATMLNGRYRFALYWPELTMGTFMKIMSTPKNVERFMEGLTK